MKTDVFLPDVILVPTTGSRLSRVKLAKLPEVPRYSDFPLEQFRTLAETQSTPDRLRATDRSRTTMSILFYLIFTIIFFLHARENRGELRDDRTN